MQHSSRVFRFSDSIKPGRGSIRFLLVCRLFFTSVLMTFAQTDAGLSVQRPNDDVLPAHNAATDSIRAEKIVATARKLEESYPDSSIAILLKLGRQSKEADFLPGIGMAYAEVGKIYCVTGKYLVAQHYLSSALLYTGTNNNLRGHVLTDLAGIFQYGGKYELALWCFEQALALTGSDNEGEVAVTVYMDLSSLLIQMHRYKDAPYYIDKVIHIAIKHNDEELLTGMLLNKGSLYGTMGKWDTSDIYMNSGLANARKYGLGELEFSALLNLGDSYTGRGQNETALNYYRQADTIKARIDPSIRLAYYRSMGRVYMQLHDKSNALQYLQLALQRSQQMGIKDVIALRRDLAQLYMDGGDYKNAALQYRTYTALKDSLQNETVIKNVNEYEVKFRTAEKDKELLEKQVVILRQHAFIRAKNVWLAGISAGVALLLLLVWGMYRTARHRRRAQQHDMQLLKKEAEIEVLKAAISGEETERKRIGRELHDGVSGTLTAVNMNIAAIQQRHPHIKEMQELDDIIGMLQHATIEVRKTAHNLIPDYLLQSSLPEVLQSFAARINQADKLHVEMACYGELDELDKAFVLFLYRIIQELVQNIIRHADSMHAAVQVRRHDDTLSITVEDDGKGFDATPPYKGLGLQQIQSRITAIEGYISIESQPEKGTMIHIELDLEKVNKKIAT